MHVVFVSNCELKALPRTRALLDRYGTRIGERAWATLITEQALDEVHSALRRSASRQTSVACYRSDAVLGLRPVWVIGNRKSYDSHGRFAVATQTRKKEFPMFLRHAALVARLSGYVHDWGKASLHFQDKLRSSCRAQDGSIPAKDLIRHEWLSAWLMREVLNILSINHKSTEEQALLETWNKLRNIRNPNDLKADMPSPNSMSSGTDAALWAVITHHGGIGGGLDGSSNGNEHVGRRGSLESTFPASTSLAQANAFALPACASKLDAHRWRQLLDDTRKTLERVQAIKRGHPYWEGVMLAARAALILADHKVSSGAFEGAHEDDILYANTKAERSNDGSAPAAQAPAPDRYAISRPSKNHWSKSKPATKSADHLSASLSASAAKRAAVQTTAQKTRHLDQPLSWHLQQVGDKAADCVRMLAGEDLPAIDATLVQAVLGLRAAADSRYAWQDRSADFAASLAGGKLVFNVAATGAGKTLGNLKIAFAMRPKQTRLAVAFNLRSLTAQTHVAFGKHIGAVGQAAAFERDFACLMGERGASAGLTDQKAHGDAGGAASTAKCGAVSGSNGRNSITHLDYSAEDGDDQTDDPILDLYGSESLALPDWIKQIAPGRTRGQASGQTSGVTENDKLLKLIASPALISTMDWIVAAGEPGEQARHAKALIRVANSDLILDEVDSYDVKAAVAVMRVVQTAATFGRNVIVSSATLNPELAHGLALAYAAGRRAYAAMTGEQDWHLVLVNDGATFDPISLRSPSGDEANAFYRRTMQGVAQALQAQVPTKRYEIATVNHAEDIPAVAIEQAARLHDRHAASYPGLPCRVSIGLVRVANVGRCMELSEALRSDGRFVVTAYHAREIALRRAEREKWLDRVLDRNNDKWTGALKECCPWIADKKPGEDVRLVVVATPVEEVGRDHDFDWAVIEPSSMHSIIQTAGRVNRHRRAAVADPNIVLLSRNWRSFATKDGLAFIRPGLETQGERARSTHTSHDLHDLMQPAAEGLEPGGVQSNVQNNVLNAALVFDEGGRKTRFAQYDEDATRHHIRQALPIIERQSELETAFMRKKYAKCFALRDGAAPFQYELDVAQGRFWLAHDKKPALNPMTWHPAPPCTWLCLDADDPVVQDAIQSAVSKQGKEQQSTNALTVSISRHSEDAPSHGKLDLRWNGVIAS